MAECGRSSYNSCIQKPSSRTLEKLAAKAQIGWKMIRKVTQSPDCCVGNSAQRAQETRNSFRKQFCRPWYDSKMANAYISSQHGPMVRLCAMDPQKVARRLRGGGERLRGRCSAHTHILVSGVANVSQAARLWVRCDAIESIWPPGHKAVQRGGGVVCGGPPTALHTTWQLYSKNKQRASGTWHPANMMMCTRKDVPGDLLS